MLKPRYCREDYTVEWICALHIELAAAGMMLDVQHEDLPLRANETNLYTLGSIGPHNVAIVSSPEGEMGNNPLPPWRVR